MADKKISQLTPATTPLAGTETLPIVQGGNTVKTTVQDVANLASSPNPTNTFVPFNNAGTFADSYAVNDTTSEVFKTTHNSSDKGLKLDFANNQYLIGKDFDKATNDYSFIGFKPYSSTVEYILELKDTVEFGNNLVQRYNPEEGYFCTASTNSPAYNTLIQQNNGLIAFQVNNVIDDNSSFVAFYAEYLNLQSNYNGGTNVVQFQIDSSNNTIQSISNGDIKGLKLDFGSKNYEFGNFDTSKGNIKIYDYDLLDYAIEIRTIPPNYNVDLSINLIPDEQISLNAKAENNPNNIYSRLNLSTGQINSEIKNFNVGSQITQGYNTIVINTYDNDNSANIVHDTLLDFQNNIARYLTQYNGNEVGLKLDFANEIYQLGDISFPFGITVDFPNQSVNLGDVTTAGNGTGLIIENINQIVKTVNQGNDIGLKLDFGLFSYKFGDFNSTNNGVYFEADDDAGVARIFSGGGYFNFEADAVTTRIGDIGGTNNGTTFGVDDQNGTLSGTTNLLSVSAGAFSGQYLKIKIGTTQYKIALLNNV